jgi:phosphatidylserine/phosphatidylglycerophosphate/cardiolipin synthase-like enzyme
MHPMVVVVSRLTEEGWLETETMGAITRAVAPSFAARGRAGSISPALSARARAGSRFPTQCARKVLIMDDELVSVGSANFNNRSMGFDNECNIAIEARGDARVSQP